MLIGDIKHTWGTIWEFYNIRSLRSRSNTMTAKTIVPGWKRSVEATVIKGSFLREEPWREPALCVTLSGSGVAVVWAQPEKSRSKTWNSDEHAQWFICFPSSSLIWRLLSFSLSMASGMEYGFHPSRSWPLWCSVY